MNKRAIIAAAVLSAGSLAIAAAVAQDTNAFMNADGNNDGVVSWEEALGAYPTLSELLFRQADSNSNGVIDEVEFVGLQGLTAGQDGAPEPVSETPSSSSSEVVSSSSSSSVEESSSSSVESSESSESSSEPD